jgi:cob(I)alamin adenosyltransferase
MGTPMKKRGFVHVYTGSGKGKTTASLGLALRACGHGWKVLMIQFMKGNQKCGETLIANQIPHFELVQSGLRSFVDMTHPSDEDRKMAKGGFTKALSAIKNKSYDLIILDEINVAIHFGLVKLEDVVELINSKPDPLELVLTGRNAHPEVVKRADYVSEILDIKHPFHIGETNRLGIEY